MEELRRENERLKQENQELRESLKQVTERLIAAEQKIKELSEQLKQNSRNSNWPSSRDKSRGKTKSLRSKWERKVGGQEGHKGYTLTFNPEPDVIEKYRPSHCEQFHALCNAHHLRELTAIVENDQQQWAVLMLACLLSAKQLVAEAQEAGQTALPADCLERIHQLYNAIVYLGLEENPLPDAHPPPSRRGRRKKTKARNLVERFVQHHAAILRFIHDFKVPFDNNLAERDIRMMKVQQKISGCFRSWQGDQPFYRLRSY